MEWRTAVKNSVSWDIDWQSCMQHFQLLVIVFINSSGPLIVKSFGQSFGGLHSYLRMQLSLL